MQMSCPVLSCMSYPVVYHCTTVLLYYCKVSEKSDVKRDDDDGGDDGGVGGWSWVMGVDGWWMMGDG